MSNCIGGDQRVISHLNRSEPRSRGPECPPDPAPTIHDELMLLASAQEEGARLIDELCARLEPIRKPTPDSDALADQVRPVSELGRAVNSLTHRQRGFNWALRALLDSVDL